MIDKYKPLNTTTMATKVISEKDVMRIYELCEFEEVKDSFGEWFYSVTHDRYEYSLNKYDVREFARTCANWDMIVFDGTRADVEASNRPELAEYINKMLDGTL